MKLIILHPDYGHIELKEGQKVKDGIYDGLDQKQLFEKIMEDGYAGGKIPACFGVTYTDGRTELHQAKDKDKVDVMDPAIEEIMVMAPMAGG